MSRHHRRQPLLTPLDRFQWAAAAGIVALLVVLGVFFIVRFHAAGVPSDINGDGKVDIADLSILAANFNSSGKTLAQGDLNGDGRVDIADLSILASGWGGAAAAVPDTLIINGQQLATAKSNIALPQYQSALAAVTKAGNVNLSDRLLSVMDKTQTPAGGDKHEYMSLSPYYWPNPDTPDGLPYVYRDGQVNPESLTISDRAEFNALVREVNHLTAAYYFTDQTRYSDKAALMIRTWFLDGATKMNPNMQYAGAIKGVSDGSFPAVLQIYELPQILDDVQILKTSPSWTASDQSGMQSWCSSYYTWVTTSTAGMKEATEPNNHGTWYDADTAALAEFLGKPAYAQNAIVKGQALIDSQVQSNGNQSLEMVRTRPWNYSTFNLSGLATLAQIAQQENIDLWHYTAPHGGSIHKALDFLAPYGSGSRAWSYPDLESPIHLTNMTITFREAATAYSNSQYEVDADNSLGTSLSSDYTSLLY